MESEIEVKHTFEATLILLGICHSHLTDNMVLGGEWYRDRLLKQCQSILRSAEEFGLLEEEDERDELPF